jgi:predicted RNase H-like HicB family nuclease
MDIKRFVYYEENGLWIGWLEEYPDYHSQGETLEELKENLKDIYEELTSGNIPQVRHIGELELQ